MPAVDTHRGGDNAHQVCARDFFMEERLAKKKKKSDKTHIRHLFVIQHLKTQINNKLFTSMRMLCLIRKSWF